MTQYSELPTRPSALAIEDRGAGSPRHQPLPAAGSVCVRAPLSSLTLLPLLLLLQSEHVPVPSKYTLLGHFCLTPPQTPAKRERCFSARWVIWKRFGGAVVFIYLFVLLNYLKVC